MKHKYQMINKRDGEIIVAEHIKDLVEFMEDANLSDEQVEFSYIEKEGD